jgi:membrane protein implicated in regulation of membrane protease activity
MKTKFFTGVALAALVGTTAVLWAPWASSVATPSACGTSYAPTLDPAHFVPVVNNPYFPLPVGRTLVYIGTKDGKGQTDRVTVTDRTKDILGITTTVVRDVARHHGDLLEKTFPWTATVCRSCRIVRVGQKNNPRPWIDSLGQSRKIVREIPERRDSADAPRSLHNQSINHEGLVGHYRFMARTHERSNRQLDQLVGPVAEYQLIRLDP